jgi:Carbon starvation protein, predicted membrane protein
MKIEKQGHFVFYGAMVCEGVIAIIWAAAGCAQYAITDGKMARLTEDLGAGQSAAMYDVCAKTMGGVGIAQAMIGVVICSITSRRYRVPFRWWNRGRLAQDRSG